MDRCETRQSDLTHPFSPSRPTIPTPRRCHESYHDVRLREEMLSATRVMRSNACLRGKPRQLGAWGLSADMLIPSQDSLPHHSDTTRLAKTGDPWTALPRDLGQPNRATSVLTSCLDRRLTNYTWPTHFVSFPGPIARQRLSAARPKPMPPARGRDASRMKATKGPFPSALGSLRTPAS